MEGFAGSLINVLITLSKLLFGSATPTVVLGSARLHSPPSEQWMSPVPVSWEAL